jgi:hypothetical protein
MVDKAEKKGSKRSKEQPSPILKLNAKDTALLKKFLQHKKKQRSEEAAMRLVEKELLASLQKKQDEDGFKGKYSSGYFVLTNDETQKVKYVSVDKYNVPNKPEVIDALKELLGAAFAKEIKRIRTVTLKSEVFKDKKLKKRLVELLGAEFSDFFMTTPNYVVTPGFDERIYEIASNAKQANEIRKLCSKTKSCLK